ncbi:flagellin N-terminal helical domain-containing protein [Magnetococcales bacterium HHB-1]
MAISIASNIAALLAQRNIDESTETLNTTFARLSSGLRINSSSDDAPGLSIATRLTSQIRGLNQAARNANDGISLIQVADGALEETTDALQTIRDLSIEASSAALASDDRESIWKEVNALMSTIDRISANTEYNDLTLLDGTYSQATNGVNFQVGPEGNETVKLNINAATASAVGVTKSIVITAFSMGGGSTGGTGLTATSAQSFLNSMIDVVDSAITSVSDIRADLGAVQSRLDITLNNLQNMSTNTESARSNIMDADIAAETTLLTRNVILQQAGVAVLTQSNLQPQLALQLLRGL